MKFDRDRLSNDSVPLSGVTKENYFDLAKDFVRARGGGFVIRALEGQKGSFATRQPATEPQWIAWTRYFAARGVPFRATNAHGCCAVPCEWPEDFDASAPLSDRFARLPRRLPPDGGAERLKAEFDRLAGKLYMAQAASQPARTPPPKSSSVS